jgi:hypothetical protein
MCRLHKSAASAPTEALAAPPFVHPIENGTPRHRLFAQPEQFRVGDGASAHEPHALKARLLFRLIAGWG